MKKIRDQISFYIESLRTYLVYYKVRTNLIFIKLFEDRFGVFKKIQELT
jgi:hypothetical protein